MFVVVLEFPIGERWRELQDHPLIQRGALALSLPPAWVRFTLRDSATSEQAAELADQFRERMDGGTVRVQTEP